MGRGMTEGLSLCLVGREVATNIFPYSDRAQNPFRCTSYTCVIMSQKQDHVSFYTSWHCQSKPCHYGLPMKRHTDSGIALKCSPAQLSYTLQCSQPQNADHANPRLSLPQSLCMCSNTRRVKQMTWLCYILKYRSMEDLTPPIYLLVAYMD